MRVVLSDADDVVCSMLEALLTANGHEVVGVAAATVAACNLIEAARPDLVIVDLTVEYNSDFDVLAAAAAVGASSIVFSTYTDPDLLDRYEPRPIAVAKPDFGAVEEAIARLAAAGRPVPHGERRVRPTKAAGGPIPASLDDANAFYQALVDASEGDALLSIQLAPGAAVDGRQLASYVVWCIRQTDRLLGTESSVRLYLAGAGETGAEAVLARLRREVELPTDALVQAVILAPGETAAEAFDRLKQSAGQAV